jgi:hypothetical protein
MIKLISASPVGDRAELDLTFSDGSCARWSAVYLIERDTALTKPLTDPAYFARAFIESGALAWPNGLELSPIAIYTTLKQNSALRSRAA